MYLKNVAEMVKALWVGLLIKWSFCIIPKELKLYKKKKKNSSMWHLKNIEQVDPNLVIDIG